MKERKVSCILEDLKLVPKRKKIRISIFITFNIIFILLFSIFLIFVKYPYNYAGCILIVGILLLFDMKSFHTHVERYPLNNYEEYKFNPKKDLINKIDGDYVITIEQKSNIYFANLKDRTLVFDMKGCILPLTVIKAYLGRQFIREYINKNKLISDSMNKNLKINSLFKEYNNLKILFKNKEKYLIKNGKTKLNIIMKEINGYGYITWRVAPRRINKYFVKINEQEFVERKEYYLD